MNLSFCPLYWVLQIFDTRKWVQIELIKNKFNPLKTGELGKYRESGFGNFAPTLGVELPDFCRNRFTVDTRNDTH
tara:strand:- start:25960 stop:26184 length:225 start_codon:yes stop_codon:yes gene_type:complete